MTATDQRAPRCYRWWRRHRWGVWGDCRVVHTSLLFNRRDVETGQCRRCLWCNKEEVR